MEKNIIKELLYLCIVLIVLEEVYSFQIEMQVGGGRITIPSFNPFLGGGFIPFGQIDSDNNDNNDSERRGEGKGTQEQFKTENGDDVTTNSYVINTNTGPIKVTEVHVRRNLNPERPRNTPIQIMRDVDTFFDSVFDNFINTVIHNQHMQIMNQMRGQKINENPEEATNNNSKKNKEVIDTRLDEDKEAPNDHKTEVNKDENINVNTIKEKEVTTNQSSSSQTNDENTKEEHIADDIQKIETAQHQNEEASNTVIKTEINIDQIEQKEAKDKHNTEDYTDIIINHKSPLNPNKNSNIIDNVIDSNNAKLIEYHEKQKQKQKVLSQICKYVFYLLILFSIYIIFKKIFQLLDLIDEDKPNPTSVTSSIPPINQSIIKKEEKVT